MKGLAVYLDRNVLEDVLSRTSNADSDAVLTLPLPDGSFVRFAIEAYPIPAHQSHAVRAFEGRSASSNLSARIEWTDGRLLAVISGLEDTVYVDPDESGGPLGYVAYYARDADRPLVAGGDLPLKAIREIEAQMDRKRRRSPAQRKISSRLLDATATGLDEAALDTDADGRVLVDITSDVVPDVLDRIEALGGTVIDTVARYRAIRARLPPEAMEALAGEGAVRRIEPADVPISNAESSAGRRPSSNPGVTTIRTIEARADSRASGASSVKPNVRHGSIRFEEPATDAFDSLAPVADAGTREPDSSEGDIAHDAMTARSQFGVDGTGIGIGVLSNGIDTLAERQASGDLPALVTVLPGQEGEGDEGTAMLEIVHDLAPGAHLYYATALGGQARFAANIEALCEAGADIVVDDVYYFREGAFQDDIVARGINNATGNGCFYFTPAANSGNLDHGSAGVWEGDFVPAVDAAPPGIEGIAHDFGDGNSNRIADIGLGFQLKWADPLGASSNDYDLYLFDETLTTLLKDSTNAQTGRQDPYEFISRAGVPVGARLVVVKTSGQDRYLRLNTVEGRLDDVTDGQIFGHMGAKRAITTAAVDVRAAGGATGLFDGSESVESFSSDGPRRIFFAPFGEPFTPGNFSSSGGVLISKPDIAAADGVSTSTPGFSDFHGTSAAAPHAAAIGALVLEAAGGPRKVTLAEFRAALAAAALDIEAEGVDRNSGAGIPMAPAAVAELRSPDIHNAPTVADAIDDQTLFVLGDASSFPLSERFHDADGDSLAFVAFSDDADIVAASVLDSTLMLAPGGRGSTTVMVRATDPGGLSALLVFVVTVDREWGQTDYDADDDGLIEIANLEQLHAIRHDLDGDSVEDAPSVEPLYFAPFPDADRDMGCANGCTGFELAADLDFEAPTSYASGMVDRGWSAAEGGPGWEPISHPYVGGPFAADFHGNGHTIANLFVDRAERDGVGLFGSTDGRHVTIRNLSLLGVEVTGRRLVGGLVGHAGSVIRGTLVAGAVSGSELVGGIAGRAERGIHRSHAAVRVSGRESVGGLVGVNTYLGNVAACYATGSVSGTDSIGGLVGNNEAEIRASYATGTVSGSSFVGGLIGHQASDGQVDASYATGRVQGHRNAGGLVGGADSPTSLRANYYDVQTSSMRVGVGSDDVDGSGSIDGDETWTMGVAGKTTAELTRPRGYRGIYAKWNVALELGHYSQPAAGADPWHFGSADQYPALRASLGNPEQVPSWQEFGWQLREPPRLWVETADGHASLAWTVPRTGYWTPPPVVTYTVYRDGGVLATNVEGSTWRDVPPADGRMAYAYQVAASIGHGEPVRSDTVVVHNRPPAPPILANQVARVGEAFRYAFAAAPDPDGDAVAYGAGALPAWLAFDTAARTFSGTPTEGDVGVSSIRVTAVDVGTPPLGTSATYALTVNPSRDDNRPPETETAIATLELSTGDIETVRVTGVFSDPDGDALSYMATAADSGVATAHPSDDALSVTATGSGETTVTVTASDGELAAEQSFVVKVANAAPRPEGIIPDRTLVFPGAPMTFDVADHFADADGDVLAYAVESSDPQVVMADSLDSTVTATPVAGGVATVTVSATDQDGSNSTARQTVRISVRVDYDRDDDGLLEVAGLAQLDAIHHDLDGDGAVGGGHGGGSLRADADERYAAAFPHPALGMGCAGGCVGYELAADLDFDTNRNGRSDAGDDYWNGGRGWLPLHGLSEFKGGLVFTYHSNTFRGTFDGNGHSISGLFIERDGADVAGGTFVGLFGMVTEGGSIQNVRLTDVDITGYDFIGAAAGIMVGTSLSGVSASGAVRGGYRVGGLVGSNAGSISGSRADVDVTGQSPVGGLAGRTDDGSSIVASYATGSATGVVNVGGLVGVNWGLISATYATGTVGGRRMGGLVGWNLGRIEASYATGSVAGEEPIGGLVGTNSSRGTIAASYSERHNDRGVSIGQPESGVGSRTTADLQGPSRYVGIYHDWDLDLDGDGANDEPWEVASGHYPALKLDIDTDGRTSWQEFGPQRGPTGVDVGRDQDDAALVVTWRDPTDTGTDDVEAYEVQRKVGDGSFQTVEPAHHGIDTTYVDADADAAAAYAYRVRAVTAGGTTNWSAPASTAPDAPSLAGEAGDAQATLTWTEPADPGISDIVGYQYQQSTDGGDTWDPAWTDVPADDGAARSLTISNLVNGTLYGFELRAVNASGHGTGSARATVIPGMFVPGAPRNLTGAAGDGRVTLSWTPPDDTGFSPVTGYEFRRSLDGGATWTVDWSEIPGGPVEHHVVHNLDNATAYTFEVRAVNASGPGHSARVTVPVRTPPTLAAPIADYAFAALDDARTLDLVRFFAVAPGGSLVYTAQSGHPELVSVRVDGNLLVITPNDDGEAGDTTITVTATDDEGRRVSTTFVVTVEPMRSLWRRGAFSWLIPASE